MMRSTISEILSKIETLRGDLSKEYDALKEKYGFYFEGKRVRFSELIRQKNKAYRESSWHYVFSIGWRSLLSMPFIYGMLIPALILDLALTIYQWTAFSCYRIPKVKRSDFFIYERRFLDYLNLVQKINCLYCSYMNGLFAYAVEIGARTERYWCPIKAAHRPRFSHAWYKDFADFGDPEDWKVKSKDNEKAFLDAYGDKCFIK